MVNPFKAARAAVSDLFLNAESSDCAPGLAKISAAIATPLVAPVAFVAALFQKGDPKP